MTDVHWHKQKEHIHAYTCRWTHRRMYAKVAHTFTFNVPHTALSCIGSMIYTMIIHSSVYYSCSIRRTMVSGNSFTPTQCRGFISNPSINTVSTDMASAQTYSEDTWPLVGLLTRSFGIKSEIPLPIKMQDREKGSCQILKEASRTHGDGRPVVRRTFLAGLLACLFTKVDVQLHDWREESITKGRGNFTNSNQYLHQPVGYSSISKIKHLASLQPLDRLKGFPFFWSLRYFMHQMRFYLHGSSQQ